MTRDQSLTEELNTLGVILRAPFEAMLAHNYAKLAEAHLELILLCVSERLRFKSIPLELSRPTQCHLPHEPP